MTASFDRLKLPPSSLQCEDEFDAFFEAAASIAGPNGELNYQDVAQKNLGGAVIDDPQTFSFLAQITEQGVRNPTSLWRSPLKPQYLFNIGPIVYSGSEIHISVFDSKTLKLAFNCRMDSTEFTAERINYESDRPDSFWELGLAQMLVPEVLKNLESSAMSPTDKQKFRSIAIRANEEMIGRFWRSEISERIVKAQKAQDSPIRPLASALRQMAYGPDQAPHRVLLQTRYGDIDLFSDAPITETQIGIVQNCLDALSPEFQEYLSASKKAPAIGIPSALMAAKLFPASNNQALFIRSNNVLVLPLAESANPLEQALSFRHEMGYWMSARLEHLHPIPTAIVDSGTFFSKYGFIALGELAPPEWEDTAIIGVAAVTSGIGLFYLVESMAALGLGYSVTALYAGFGTYVIPRAENDPALGLRDFRGNLLSLQEAFHELPDRSDCQDKTVSPYACENRGEWFAEVVASYLTEGDEAVLTGAYDPNVLHGWKSRQELMEKHPEVYLMFELFFAKDSPLRFNNQAFHLDALDAIRFALQKSGGQIPSAREIVFTRQSLPE